MEEKEVVCPYCGSTNCKKVSADGEKPEEYYCEDCCMNFTVED